MSTTKAYVGLDVHKDSIAVAIAPCNLNKNEVLFYGNITNTPEQLRKLVKKLHETYQELEFVYEAGPCGYVIYRQLLQWNEKCNVVAPSHIMKKPTDRIKNDHRDAVTLAKLARMGELTEIWVPDEAHEAMRDLVRARHAANKDLKVARQRIQSFLLKYDKQYAGKPWTYRHRIWLANFKFAHEAQQIAFQSYINAMEQALARREQLEAQMRELCLTWSLAPMVEALQALRGVGLIIAITMIAELGDIRRFDNPKQLMAFLGLIPGEHSSGSRIRPRGIIKTGNKFLRSLLYEAAWSYRQRAKVGAYLLTYMPAQLPQAIKDIAWKAQLRLRKRYKQLVDKGKKSQVAITAVARELIGFMWAIALQIPLTNSAMAN